MKKVPVFLTFLLIVSSSVAFSDTSKGKALHTEKCTSCHMMKDHTAMYTRKDHKVDSLKRLGGMVSACVQNLNVDWFPEDEKEVVKYLNATYYKFPEK